MLDWTLFSDFVKGIEYPRSGWMDWKQITTMKTAVDGIFAVEDVPLERPPPSNNSSWRWSYQGQEAYKFITEHINYKKFPIR